MSGVLDFPVSLRLRGRNTVLIGGGTIATQRAEQLLDAGARLTVVALQATDTLRAFANAGRLRLIEREYVAGDLAGAELVFSATTERSVSIAVAVEARAAKVWLNAADEPDLCDFTLPSVGRKGAITVAVSTAGNAPAVAARLRRELVAAIGPEPQVRVALSGWLRRWLPRSPLRMRVLRWVAGKGPRARRFAASVEVPALAAVATASVEQPASSAQPADSVKQPASSALQAVSLERPAPGARQAISVGRPPPSVLRAASPASHRLRADDGGAA